MSDRPPTHPLVPPTHARRRCPIDRLSTHLPMPVESVSCLSKAGQRHVDFLFPQFKTLEYKFKGPKYEIKGYCLIWQKISQP